MHTVTQAPPLGDPADRQRNAPPEDVGEWIGAGRTVLHHDDGNREVLRQEAQQLRDRRDTAPEAATTTAWNAALLVPANTCHLRSLVRLGSKEPQSLGQVPDSARVTRRALSPSVTLTPFRACGPLL